jgi:hypothetical protein
MIQTLLDSVQKNRKDDYPYNKCSNKLSLSGQPITLFTEEDLILYTEELRGITYCFPKSSIYFLLKIRKNPYTGFYFSDNVYAQLSDFLKIKNPIEPYPLNTALDLIFNRKVCPIIGIQKGILYYRTSVKILTSELFKKETLSCTPAVKSMSIGKYIYRIVLKSDKIDKFLVQKR